MNKNPKHKLTPEVYKSLIEVAKSLPSFQRVHDDGRPMSRVQSKLVRYEDLTPEQQKQIKKPDPSRSYTVNYAQPIFVNHELNIIECYKNDGQPGADAYANYFREEYARVEAEKEALKAKEAEKKEQSPLNVVK